jgi:hypothetical protein
MRLRRRLAITTLLLVLVGLVSCKTSDDARALAGQMSATANSLCDYYAALAQMADNHAKLERLQQATLGVPLDPQDVAQLQDIQASLQNRSEMAHALAGLAGAFIGFSNSTAPSDVSASATNLGTALSSIPKLANSSYTPTALQNAGKIVTQLLQERDERKMAKDIDPLIAAISQMYSQEKPAYDSIDKTYIGLAQSIALDLVNRNQVDPNSLMAPALRPFDLSSRIPTEQLPQGLADYAREQIRNRTAAEAAAHAQASDTLDAALKEVSKQTHGLATQGHMPDRIFPITLDKVQTWIKFIL